MLNQIHEEVAKELNLPLQTVKEIHKFKTKWIKEQMRTASYVKIIDTNLGIYKLCSKRLAKRIKTIKKYKAPTEVQAQQLGRYKLLVKRNMQLKYSRKNKLGVFRTENTIYE